MYDVHIYMYNIYIYRLLTLIRCEHCVISNKSYCWVFTDWKCRPFSPEPRMCHSTNDTDYTMSVPGISQIKTLPCKDDWNIIARRGNNTTNFSRTWSEYANGFGNTDDDFWLGNQVMVIKIVCSWQHFELWKSKNDLDIWIIIIYYTLYRKMTLLW